MSHVGCGRRLHDDGRVFFAAAAAYIDNDVLLLFLAELSLGLFGGVAMSMATSLFGVFFSGHI